MTKRPKEPESALTDREPSGSTHKPHTAQTTLGKWDGIRRGGVFHQPTGLPTTKTVDISNSSQKRYADDIALQKAVIRELMTEGAKCGTKIVALLHLEAPRRMMAYLAGQGYVREITAGNHPKKRMPVWGATAAGLRFVEGFGS